MIQYQPWPKSVKMQSHLLEGLTVKNYLKEQPAVKRTPVQKFKKIIMASIRNPFVLISKIISSSRLKYILNDRLYIYLRYRGETGLHLNFRNPTRFNEKLQVLKLDKELFAYSRFTDKYEVRKFVAQTIGLEYLIPLIKLYDSVDEIDFEQLPDQFVLKCTHDSGTIVICRDKSTLDQEAAKKILSEGMQRNYFYEHREPQYKHIVTRIICQEFLSTAEGSVPSDYKIFCFNGIPKYIEVDTDRFENHGRVIYDTHWKKAPFTIKFLTPDVNAEKPHNLEEMLVLSAKLSQPFQFVRVDLFSVNGKIYFVELTFQHGAGYEKFFPDEYDLKLGELLTP